jgi:hypothetical protein
MYYMLNLVFDYNDSSAANGRFVDYNSAQTDPLMTSKAWLKPSAAAPPTPDPNDPSHWTFAQKDAQQLNFAISDAPTLAVRVVDANQGSYSARITILVARNTQGNAPQPISSPILNASVVAGPLNVWDTMPPTGSSLPYVPANTTSGSVKSWVTPLGQANQGSGSAKNKYIMLVAATIQSDPARTLSHDPDMNVDM